MAGFPTAQLAPGNQPLTRHPHQLTDGLCHVLGAGGLDHGQIEAVAREAAQRLAVLHELDAKGTRPGPALGPAFEITQQGRLVAAAQQHARIAQQQARGDGRQTNKGLGTDHGRVSASRIPLGSGERRHRTSALAEFQALMTTPCGAPQVAV